MTHFVTCSEGRFAYLAWGEEGAPLVLCLHGFPDTPHSFDGFATKLSSLGYRVVAPWLRGYAPSTLDGPITLQQLVDDTKGLIEALAPNKKVFIFGHDWGAAITYLTLSQHPELFARAVAASVPHPQVFFKSVLTRPSQLRKSWYFLFFQFRGLADYVVARNNFALIEKLWRAWSPGYKPSASELSVLKECLSRSTPGPVNYYRALFWPPLTAWKQLRDPNEIHTPLMYAHGGQDGCIEFESRRGQETYCKAGYQELLIEEAGHFLTLEAPDRLADETHRWFKA